jgi:hypothetical protein
MPKPKPDDPYGTESMFDVEPLRDGTRRRRTTVKSVAQGKCPSCTRVKVGLITIGVHTAWRAHTYRTYSGATMPCPASNIAVCRLPERVPLDPSSPVRCAHGEPG